MDAYEVLNTIDANILIEEKYFNQLKNTFQNSYLTDRDYNERLKKHRNPIELKVELLAELNAYLIKIQNREEMRDTDLEKKSSGHVNTKVVDIWKSDRSLRTSFNSIKEYCKLRTKDFNTVAVHFAEYRALSKLYSRIERSKEEHYKMGISTKNYTVCIDLPNNYYTINGLTEDDVFFIAGAYEKQIDSFFYLGTKYNIKDIRDFKIFECNNPNDYHEQINKRKDILDEGYFVGNKVYFKPYSIAKLFPDVTERYAKRTFLGGNLLNSVSIEKYSATNNHALNINIMTKPKIFVGSSTEGLEVAYAIQQNLEHDAEVTCWPQGIFQLSKTAISSLIDSLTQYDFAIFVFSPDDTTNLRGTTVSTVRDNVIYETGLFTGKLGIERVFIKPRNYQDLHLPTDLLGVNAGEYDASRSDKNLIAATGPFCNQVRKILKDKGSLMSVITNKDLDAYLDYNIAIEILTTYFMDKGWTSMGFEKIEKYVHPKLTEKYLMKLIEVYPKVIRQFKLENDIPRNKIDSEIKPIARE